MDEFEVTLTKRTQETPRDRTLCFQVAEAEVAAFGFEPGQYVCLFDPARPEGPRSYFSISGGDPETGRFQLTLRREPDREPAYYAADVGQVLRIVAPAGRLTFAPTPGVRLILAAAGSGAAPFRAHVEALTRHPDAPRTVLLHSSRRADELVFQDAFERWARTHAWLRYEPLVTGADPAWTGRRGRLGEAALVQGFQRWTDAPARTVVLACGPNPFVDAVLEAAEAAGVLPEHCRREGG